MIEKKTRTCSIRIDERNDDLAENRGDYQAFFHGEANESKEVQQAAKGGTLSWLYVSRLPTKNELWWHLAQANRSQNEFIFQAIAASLQTF